LSELKRRTFVPLAGLMLAAYYFIVLRPLAHRADSLDAPLREAWQKLVTSLEQTNAAAVDFLHITNQLSETRQSLILLENAKQKAGARLELGAVVRARMNAPFQLVEYEDERSKEVDALTKLAKTQQVTIEPAVFAGFPEQTAETRQPLILWPALSFIDQLLTAALQCKVSAIRSL